MVDQASVLHVEDDPDFAAMTAAFLERVDEAIEVVTVSSAAAALDRLDGDAHGIDCVVSDYDMPGMDGLAFLDAVRESHPDLPFVLFTGKGSEEIASEAIARGATDYLQKGGTGEKFELLANRVLNVVEQYRSTRRAAELQRVRTVVREVNRALVRADSRDEIGTRVCDILSATDPYGMATIGEVDPETKEIHVRTVRGVDESYFDGWEMNVDTEAGRQAPGGRAFHEREVAVSQDVQSDPDYERWHRPAVERGLRSLAVVPLGYDDHLYGLLAIMSSRPNAFDEDERELLAELGDDVAHALRTRELSVRERAIDEAPVGVTIADPSRADTPLVYVNDTFVELTGYPREETLGRSCRFLQGPETRAEPVREMRAALDAEEPVTVELRNYRTDGETFWNRVSLVPLTDDRGEVEHWVGFQQDVTEWIDGESGDV
jgi:PAS domain S-box-containing protein